ncbi:ATP-grasp fold amidoligase family protein [Shimia aestuarii]|uniref:ATP-grasp fold amidoligase family protein n=1 Tax=Shimia aestuarii TaxID=254406 RepID=UPI001FB31381|nr:ATP-grasp fold amidoligase family protein [Shimia aestuarii]
MSKSPPPATKMTDACRAFVQGVETRRRRARRRAQWLPRVKRGAYIHDASFRNDIEAVAYPLARVLGRIPDFANPGTYLEKLRSLYLTHPNPLMPLVADKIGLRAYCDLFDLPLAPLDLLATYEDPREVDLATLPPACFLKVNDGCKMHLQQGPGMPITPFALRHFRWELWHYDHWRRHGELHYRDIPRRLLLEEAMLPSHELRDCGVYCAMGKPYMFFTKTHDRYGRLQDRAYIPLEDGLDCLVGGARETRALYDLGPPDQIDAIIETSRLLSQPFLDCRIDFMRLGNRTVVGEITLSPGALMLLPDDPEVEIIRGNLLDMSRLDDLLAEGKRIAANLGWPTETSFGHISPDDPRLATAGQDEALSG